jgi:outer membrane protein assembly factor BamB
MIWKLPVKGDIWSSALVADGKIYVGSRNGQLSVFKAGREGRLLSTVEMGAAISGTPTAANGVLYVSTARKLFAIGITAVR